MLHLISQERIFPGEENSGDANQCPLIFNSPLFFEKIHSSDDDIVILPNSSLPTSKSTVESSSIVKMKSDMRVGFVRLILKSLVNIHAHSEMELRIQLWNQLTSLPSFRVQPSLSSRSPELTPMQFTNKHNRKSSLIASSSSWDSDRDEVSEEGGAFLTLMDMGLHDEVIQFYLSLLSTD